MFNSPFMNGYNSQITVDKLDEQINNLKKLKSQIQQPQPTNLTQNFQLAPSNRDTIRYANSIEDVQREMVMGETPFFSKDMSVVWVKNTQSQIKTYELTEIIPKDEKDIQIEFLQAQIDELKKGMVLNEQSNTNDATTKDETNPTKLDETTRGTTKKSKSTSVQGISTSKKE